MIEAFGGIDAFIDRTADMNAAEVEAELERVSRETALSAVSVALRLLLEFDGMIAGLGGPEPSPDSELALLAAIAQEDGPS
jgi:hypothetical protein